jgi:hypothetical protein
MTLTLSLVMILTRRMKNTNAVKEKCEIYMKKLLEKRILGAKCRSVWESTYVMTPMSVYTAQLGLDYS